MSESEEAFVAARRSDWETLGTLLDGGQAWHRLPPETLHRAASLYRSVSGDVMRARSAGYPVELTTFLDGLAARAHAALYSAPPYRLGAVVELMTRDFPRAVRRYRRFVAFAALLFVLPGVVGFVGSRRSHAFAVQIMPAEMAEQMQENYAKDVNAGRATDEDAFMAGFYVHNNVGIAFRCFATGILFGLGSVFFLVYNGLLTGVVAGLVDSAGHGKNLLTFIAGHGAFELTAIVLSGAAGIVMGYALVSTQGLTRFASLARHARELAHLVLGVAVMLLCAAGIEAFWSPSSVPGWIKLSVAGVLWVVVLSYLTFAGREPRGARP